MQIGGCHYAAVGNLVPVPKHQPLANGAAIPYVRASFRNQASHNAAVTTSTSDDDGRANALVRRYSALGLTERLT
jgi:hypothetical protein